MKTSGMFAGSYQWGWLRCFEPDPERVAMPALTAELANRFPTPTGNDWSAVAELVTGFCRAAGFDVVFSHQTEDGSAQFHVVNGNNGNDLLECTRVHSGPLQCTLPRVLARLVINWQAQTAQLITLPDPDQAAELKTADLSSLGHTLPLAAATTLLTHLDCYTTDLDPLGTLDAKRREAIITSNRQLAG
ncbi:MAG: hypothetical protein ABIF77_03740 [bacterium]